MARELSSEFEVSEASSYEEGVERLEAETEYAAIVSDFDLGPGPSGFDVLARAKELQPDAPRMIVSGSLPLDESQAALECGLVKRVLTKPRPSLGLLEAVRELTAAAARTELMRAGAERRSDPRFPARQIDVLVRFDIWREPRAMSALDVSRGGIALRIPHEPALGDWVRVSPGPPSHSIYLEGEVRHVESAQNDRRSCRVGVQFQNLDGACEAVLDRMLDCAQQRREGVQPRSARD